MTPKHHIGVSPAEPAHGQPQVGRLRIYDEHGFTLTVALGDGGATITAGLGGWQTVQRVDDVAATDWTGQEPVEQTVPIMLDGYAQERSVQGELNQLFKLALGDQGDPPPVFQIEGPIHFPGKHWVLPDGGLELDSASVIRDTDGTLLRQALNLHLLEFVKPDEIRLRGGKHRGVGKAQALTFTVRKDADTLMKIAALALGSWKRWKELGKRNGISDPHRKLKIGRVLKLP